MAYRFRCSLTGLATLALALAVALVRCGSSSPATGAGGSGNSAVCLAGYRVACGCADGSESAKACKPDGSGYFACICEMASAGAAGEGGAASEGGAGAFEAGATS